MTSRDFAVSTQLSVSRRLEVEGQLRSGLEMWNTNPRSYRALANLYLSTNQTQKAVMMLNETSRLISSGSSLHQELGAMYAQAGDFLDAGREWALIGTLNEDTNLLVSLGLEEQTRGNTSPAEKFFRGALVADPRSVNAMYALGDLLWGEYPNEAQEYLERAVSLDTQDSARKELAMGRLSFVNGDLEIAERELEKALSLDPTRRDIRHWLGATLLAEGRASEAEMMFRAEIKLYPDNYWSYVHIAYILNGRKDYAGTIALLQPILEKAKDIPELHGEFGIAMYQEGLAERACSELGIATRSTANGIYQVFRNLACAFTDGR